MSYDQIVVLENLVNCGDQSGRALMHASSFELGWIDIRALASFREFKKQLWRDVVELEAEVRGLEFAPLYEPSDCGMESVDAVPPCSFWPSVTEDGTPEILTIGVEDSAEPIGSPWCQFPSRQQSLVGSNKTHHCPRCGSPHVLVEKKRATSKQFVIESSWCLFCGLSTGGSLFAPVGLAEPLLLARILISAVLSGYRSLLGLVSAAIARLLSRLRLDGIHSAIATCQRNFFTHHGAHPPRFEPQRELGLFLEKAFQLQLAL